MGIHHLTRIDKFNPRASVVLIERHEVCYEVIEKGSICVLESRLLLNVFWTPQGIYVINSCCRDKAGGDDALQAAVMQAKWYLNIKSERA